MYNPNLLRRASGIVQNGSVLGKQFQPHESHIPYILKFFIDYNLFGMSYLHVPLQFVHPRQADDTSRFRKRSVSQLEVDFKAVHILNRLAAAEEDSTKAANPGIESLWEDERLRRSAMDPDSVPPLGTVVSQPNKSMPTESDLFFRAILRDKLAEKSDLSSLSMMETSSLEGSSPKPVFKKKFDLNNLLDGSAYAAEFSQSSLSTKSSQSQGTQVKSSDESNVSLTIEELEQRFLNFNESQTIEELENHFLNSSTPIDDEVRDKPFKEGSGDEFELDSMLAPLTQAKMPDLNKTLVNSQPDEQETIDSDEEMFNDLNETVADMEIFSQYVEDEVLETFPQLDGVDDETEDLSPSEITRQKDKKMNFHPQPGPSHLFISPLRVPVKAEVPSPSMSFINSQETQRNLMILASQMKKSPEEVKMEVSPVYCSDDDEDDDHIKSFYNQTMMIDDFASSSDSEMTEVPPVEVKKEKTENFVITPATDPPDPSEVLGRLREFNIPNRVNPVPFYSNPKDVTGRKEVGHNLLEIATTRLCDLEEFRSCLRPDAKKPLTSKTKHVRDTIAICLHKDPPSYQDAVDWLKGISKEGSQPEEESPVKEKFEKTLLVLELDDENSEDLNQTLMPSTPTTPDVIPSSQEKDTTPLSQFIEDGIFLSFSARKKMKKMKKSFSRRFQEIMMSKAASAEAETENSSQSDRISEDTVKASESSQTSTGSSDTTLIVKNANFQEDVSFNNSELSGPSLNNTYGFKMKLESLQANDEHTDLTILAMEIHTQTRSDLKPNPEFDAISAIFFSLDGFYVGNEVRNINGIITIQEPGFHYTTPDCEVTLVKSEMDIFETFFHKIREYDPDIFAGYEIEQASWGYFMQRGYALNMNLNNALSRMPTDKHEKEAIPAALDEEDQRDQGDYYSEQKIPGRILLDVWRLMRHEIALTSYTFENICYHVLHRR